MKTIIVSRRILLHACVAAVALSGGTSWGFKPEYTAHGHTMITKSVLSLGGYAFGNYDGNPLTVPGFKFRYATSITDQVIQSWAIEHIVQGVQSRDWGIGDTSCAVAYKYFGASNPVSKNQTEIKSSDGYPGEVLLCISEDLNTEDGHFDNDNFLGSIKSIVLYVNLAIQYARESAAMPAGNEMERQRSRVASRFMLGKAIHTLQDFYAHSNWTDIHKDGALAEFITDYVSAAALQPNQASLPPFSAGTAATLMSQTMRKKGVAFPAGQGGGTAAGNGCIPRDYRFYTGLNTWDNNDGNWDVAKTATSPITSAAWWDSLSSANAYDGAASDIANAGRCDHGVFDGEASTSKFSGIAKDLPAWPQNPKPRGVVTGEGNDAAFLWDYSAKSNYNWWGQDGEAILRAAADATDEHKLASYAAARHTTRFLDVFIGVVRAQISDNQEADSVLSTLFGGPPAESPSSTWVVDRSGTMADLLPSIKAFIDNSLQPGKRYVLVDFAGSSEVGGQTSFGATRGDATTIRSSLSRIEARGGGGCSTPTWEAVQKAISLSDPGATVYVITDASASDAVQEPVVTAQAQAKNLKLVIVPTGSCSPLDQSYGAGAASTGGSVRLIEHTADGIAAAFASASLDDETPRVVHSESATLSGSKTVSFPVETGASKLSITMNGNLSAVSVTQPSGSVLTAGAGISISPVLNGWIYVIASPAQGSWQVALTGSGAYSMNAHVLAPIDFDSVEHKSVLQVGRSGHEYRPQLAQKGQSGRVWLKTRIAGAQPPVALDLLRLDGSVISTLSLSRMSTDLFEGEATLPAEAHRFRVRGFAADGTAFARIHGQGNVAPPVALPGRVVASMGAAGTWRAGTVNAFAINLKNLGGDDTVSFASGTLPSGATLTCNPSSIAIPGSEQVNVLCSIFLPEAPDRGDFSVVVSSTTAVPAASQTVTVPLTPLKLPLSCALDIDGDNRIDPAVDGLLLTRYLLGFRGNALTANLTIPGPRNTAALLGAFFGNAAQFDLIGRSPAAPTATVDGLLMTRMMLGFDDIALLNGIALPAGAQYTTAAAIKDNVIARCAGGF